VREFSRYALPLAALAMLLLIKLWPALRLRARTGKWPVERGATRTPAARAMVGLISLVSTALLVWIGLYAWLGPARLGIRATPTWLAGAGWSLMGLSCMLIAWSQAVMGDSWRMGLADDQPPLVRHGPYRIVRHPIYLGWWLFVVGVALVTPGLWSALLVAAFAGVLTGQAALEDRHLTAKLGAEHAGYRARVGGLLPRVAKRAANNEQRT
jgi:protein-S-isoprenylcysteine O-methyltransferase Ste14